MPPNSHPIQCIGFFIGDFMKPELTQELLNELLNYNPDTGELYWKSRSPSDWISLKSAEAFNRKFAGRQAFTTNDGAGYKTGRLLGKKYQAHRIIWMMVYGFSPVGIDHIDDDGCNNRLSNLKEIKAHRTPAQKNAPRRALLNKVDVTQMEINQENLSKVLSYNPHTGLLIWKERPISWFSSLSQHKTWNRRYANKPAINAIRKNGYRGGCIFGKAALAHRIVWIMQTGEIPESIDHINGVRSDNRLENLRSVSHEENMRNQKRKTNCTSGKSGVQFHEKSGKWKVNIGVKGRKKHVGYFDTQEAAVKAREKAEAMHGYHPNHGRA